MNKLFFITTFTAITMLSCSPGNSKTNDTAGAKKEQTALNDNEKGGTSLINKQDFLKKVWNYEVSPEEWKFLGDKPAIIDFYADWCGPCRIASPILEDVSKEFAGKIDVYKIDTQQERELAGVFGIQSIPAFLYIPIEGKPVMMAGIGRSEEETRAMFVENINKYLLTDNNNK